MQSYGSIQGRGKLAVGDTETIVEYRIVGYLDGAFKTAIGTIAGDVAGLWSIFGKPGQTLQVDGGEAKVIITRLSGGDGEIRCSGRVPGL
jgi:hypothetical protein